MIEVKFTFETEEEMLEWMREIFNRIGATEALAKLRMEMRQVNKYGEPTERDEYWYSQLFHYCEEEEVDASINLSDEDFEKLKESEENPPDPNPSLKQLLAGDALNKWVVYEDGLLSHYRELESDRWQLHAQRTNDAGGGIVWQEIIDTGNGITLQSRKSRWEPEVTTIHLTYDDVGTLFTILELTGHIEGIRGETEVYKLARDEDGLSDK